LIVVDASVAVKWFVPEPGSEAAERVLAGSEKLLAPALIRVEVAAAITRKLRLGELDSGSVERACRLWFVALARGVVTLSPDEADLESAITIAIEMNHPLQDCLYLALARRAGAALLTADEKFTRRAARAYGNVRHLG